MSSTRGLTEGVRRSLYRRASAFTRTNGAGAPMVPCFAARATRASRFSGEPVDLRVPHRAGGIGDIVERDEVPPGWRRGSPCNRGPHPRRRRAPPNGGHPELVPAPPRKSGGWPREVGAAQVGNLSDSVVLFSGNRTPRSCVLAGSRALRP